MYETFPKKSGQGKSGSKSGWMDGNGTKYPGGKPKSEDMTNTVKLNMQKCGGGSAAGKSYPKHKGYGSMFPELNGLPS